MKKIVALAAVPLGIIAAAACAVPWYVGMQTEQTMRAEAGKLNADAKFPLNVSYTRYERGWLSSNAITRLTLKVEPSIYVDVRHDISQMPDPQAGWVRVHSVPQWSGPLKAALDGYFGTQPALMVDTVIGFDGSRQTAFNSPAFHKQVTGMPGTRLDWGGLQGRALVGADQRLAATVTMPHLGFEGGDNQGSFENLKLEAHWDMRGTTVEWQGDTKVTLAQFSFAGPRGTASVKDLSGAVYQRSKGDNVLFGYVLSAGSGTSVKSGEAAESFSNAVLDVEIDQINKKALARYLDIAGGSENAALAPNQFNPVLTLELAGEVLRGSPVIRLKKLAIETPAGGMLAQATVSFDGTGLSEIRMSPELLMRLKAKGNVEIGAGLLRSQLQRKTRPQVEVALSQQGTQGTEESIKALAEKLTDEQLKRLTDIGFLHSNGTSFTVEAEFNGAQVLVNGVPASQLLGGSLAPPVSVEQMKPAAHQDQEASSGAQAPVVLVQRAKPAPAR